MQAITKKAILLLGFSAVLSFGAVAQSLPEGIKMVKYERYSSAEKILQPLAATDPIANYYLGLTQLGHEDKTAARATFSKYPEDPANMAGMARIAFMEGNAAEGQRLATAVADKAKKKDWQTLVFAADAINYGGGNVLDAVKYYEEALKRGGDNVDVRIGLGDAYQKMAGGGGKSMDNYESAVAKDAKNSLGYSRIGKLWYAARNYQDALTNYAKAKEADPQNPLPYKDLANAYFYVGKYDLARQNIEEYLKLSDQSCDDKINYANILFLGKDYTLALSKMQEVMGSCGEKPYMYRVLGYSQAELKDYPNALQNMRTLFAKTTDPKKIVPSDYKYMALIHSGLKQVDSADFYFTKMLNEDTSSNKKAVYKELAEAYKGQNTEAAYAKSALYYKMMIDANPSAATATDYFNWGLMEYYGKHYTEAGKAFEQMEAKFPEQPSSTYWRARVAAAEDNEGKTGAAVPHFNKWLAIPDSESYKHKPADLNLAYQYLAIVSYNKNDKPATKEYIAKIKSIDPSNALAAQLESLLAKPAGNAKPAPKK